MLLNERQASYKRNIPIDVIRRLNLEKNNYFFLCRAYSNKHNNNNKYMLVVIMLVMPLYYILCTQYEHWTWRSINSCEKKEIYDDDNDGTDECLPAFMHVSVCLYVCVYVNASEAKQEMQRSTTTTKGNARANKKNSIYLYILKSRMMKETPLYLPGTLLLLFHTFWWCWLASSHGNINILL